MKGMKGRFLKKLKFIPTISTMKQGLVLQLNPSQNFPNHNCHIQPLYKEPDQESNNLKDSVVGNLGVPEQDHKDDEMEFMELEFNVGNQENITPSIDSKDTAHGKSFSPASILSDIIMEQNCVDEPGEENEENLSLVEFEENCPPGGEESVIFYTTSLRGIRKTFEDCNSIRFLLESFRVSFHERDVSMHLEFREELWRILGGRMIPPRLFIKGRYIGGADEVVGLHEQGKLKKLLEGIPLGLSNSPCKGCANMRFLVCSTCNGSHKVFADGESDELCIRCPDCNENGLIKCLICN